MSGLCSAIFLVILSLYFNSESTKCPETALFAPRRKRAACKAALRHRHITAPRSPFSGILKLGSGERRRYPMVFLCGIYLVSFKPSCALSFNSDRRPATCPDGPFPLARVCISSFCMTCLEQKKERLAFVVCFTVENEAWELEREAVPVRCCRCRLDWITEPEISTDRQHRQTKRDCERRQGKESFTELEKARASAGIQFIPPMSDILGAICAVCVCVSLDECWHGASG